MIAGTLMLPADAGPHPAVIIAHSSGTGERHGYMHFASQFVQCGLAVLGYDRRGHGLSTGGGPFTLDSDVLADDMRKGFSFLQSRTDIDPQRIGLMGFSNGTWAAPRAAQDLPDVAFISVSMASAVSQVDAELYRRESVLRMVGFSEAAIAQSVEFLELYCKGVVSSLDDAERAAFADMYEAIAANEELQAAPGFNLLPTSTPLEDILAAGGTMAYMGFSPKETYLATDAPVAVYLGELDENLPPDLTIAAMRDVISLRPRADITLFTYPKTYHPMYVLDGTPNGVSQDFLTGYLASYDFAPGYIPQLRAWLRENSGLEAGR